MPHYTTVAVAVLGISFPWEDVLWYFVSHDCIQMVYEEVKAHK